VLQERLLHTQSALDLTQHSNRQRLNDTVQELRNVRHDNAVLQEQVTSLRQQLSEADKRKTELDEQLGQANHRIGELQETVREMTQRHDRLMSENRTLSDNVTQLQHAAVENRQQMEKLQTELNCQLIKTTEVSKARDNDVSNRQKLQKRNEIKQLKEENSRLQLCIQQLEQQMMDAEHEHSHRLLELTSHRDKESVLDNERIRSAQKLMEHKIHTIERDHRLKVNCLEEQISTLQHQLDTATSSEAISFNTSMKPLPCHSSGTHHEIVDSEYDEYEVNDRIVKSSPLVRRRLDHMSPVRQSTSSTQIQRTELNSSPRRSSHHSPVHLPTRN
jgi:rootletin